MTTARPKQKRAAAGVSPPVALVCGAAFVFLLSGSWPAGAAAERVVVDWHSGLAIGGYDPVAFFTEGKPVPGSGKFELRFGDAVWRFANPGNQAAFATNPSVYMPQYGGYDPIGVAHDVAVPGNPNLWLIVGNKLFLFYDTARLQSFAADADHVGQAADREWPALLRTLNP